MINPGLIDWIRGYLSKGYSKKQLTDYLVEQGYSPSEVDDTIRAVTNPESVSTSPPVPRRRTHGILIVLIIIVMIAIFGTLGYFWWSAGNSSSNPTTTAIPISTSTQPAVQAQSSDVNCSNLPANLDSCTPYECNATYSLFGINMSTTYKIKGITNGGCSYVQYISNNWTMYCNNLSVSERQAMAQYYTATLVNGNYSSNSTTGSNGQINSTYTVNGTTYNNPMQTAMNDGKCVLTGFDNATNSTYWSNQTGTFTNINTT